MHRLLLAVVFLLFSFLSQAQQTNLAWFTDITEAKSYAQENHVDILMVFAGSDWCKPCIQFKQDILLSPAFASFAKDQFAVLYLDFPARNKNRLSDEQTAHNEALAERFNSSGIFPKIVLLNSDEQVLAEPEFKQQSVDSFIEQFHQNQVHND